MKKQQDIINDLISYRAVMIYNAKEARKCYYLEERKFYRVLRFNEFLNNRSKLNMLEDILGLENSNIQIVIYA